MRSSSTPSRRERPAKPALTRAGIVAAATSVMRAEGVGRVTMRRLAKELDTGAASLYVYVSDTDELHALILDDLLGEVDLTAAAAGGDWRERLWQVVSSYRDVLYAHPSLARVALTTRLSGPHYLAIAEVVLALLDEGGMDPHAASWAVDVLLLVGTAAAVEQGSRHERPGAAREHEVMTNSVLSASPRTYPHIAAIGEDLVSGTPATRTRWAFDALVNGAFHTPRPTTG